MLYSVNDFPHMQPFKIYITLLIDFSCVVFTS